MFFALFVGIVLATVFNTSAAEGDEERTVEISIIVIAALVIFFLLIAWCGFLFGLWRNRKFAKEIKKVEQSHQLRQQQWKQRQQQRKQQLQEEQHHLQQQLQQQQLQQQQQQQQQQQIGRAVLHPPQSHLSHSRQSSGASIPSAPPLPLTVPPRDYPDYSPSFNASVSSGIGYQSRGAFDHLQGYGSPEHSFTNPGYRSTASPQNHTPLQSGYSPMPPRSTSTPATKKPHKTSQPSTFENSVYNMEMHQYSQLQNWPQNY